jgi:hypothetical protein
MCGGVVGDGLVGVHDSPGLVTVCNLSCHPSMEELGGWGIGRGGWGEGKVGYVGGGGSHGGGLFVGLGAVGLVEVSGAGGNRLGRDRVSCLIWSIMLAMGVAIMFTEAWSLASSSAERRDCACSCAR